MNILSFKTSLGWITVSEDNYLVSSVEFGRKNNNGKSVVLKKLKKQIIQFIKRKRKKFSVNLKLKGTPLQKKIWRELSIIKYGSTKTYGDIAKKLNTSPRYVGNVCGQNNHLLIIPCHRVIRSDGTLGGFSGLGGIKLKSKLLEIEQL
tara:strand:+ start:294 stop:737 length:444 start_codon:yes stop_codon:yes gene_type:complete